MNDSELLPQAETIELPRTARDAALDWLVSRINYERTPNIPYLDRQLKLDRMRQLLARLGQPDAGMKIVHVAGTKGKGSTSAMVASILSAAGYRTGVFSSPHLERIEERFAVDATPCTTDQFVALVDRMRPVVRAMDEEAAAVGDPGDTPTYFEITTAMALVHFVECGVDAAVLEVGLGGRLDSTNVCLPAVSVITSISFDHTKQLGNTLAAIAGEKAGIIKPGVPVVCGVTPPEPQAVIAGVAREHGCRLIQAGREFVFEYTPPRHDQVLTNQGSIHFRCKTSGQEFELRNVQLAMRGPHQAANAATALATVLELRHQGWCISSDAMRQGLSTATLPGRFEVIAGIPLVVLDTAHNAASAKALVDALAELPHASRRTLIVSISHDKDVLAILREFVGHFERIIATQYQENPRAIPVDQLHEFIKSEHKERQAELIVCRTPLEAWHFARASALPGECIYIAGSFFLASELRGQLRS